jgi:competence protein ComEC
VTRAHVLLLAATAGLVAANFARPEGAALLVVATAAAAVALARGASGLPFLVIGAAVLAWWWGGARLDAIDASPLAGRVGTADRAIVEVVAPARRGRFDIRVLARALRFGSLAPHEPVLLELPLGRAPPLGARLELIGTLAWPRESDDGFDERTWLRRRGVHVVLRADRWRRVGWRGGAAGIGDSLHRWLAARVGQDLRGERRSVVEGVVLGEDEGLSDELRQSFRASGLYHLLAVSGQNVALVAAGALMLAWLVGFPRVAGEVGALAAMGAYVAAVGSQPSVLRAGIAAALGSLAWLTARARDRWHALLLGAFALLAWNPYTVHDAGFQLSFAAVASIYTIAPRVRTWLDGYPVPPRVADVAAVSVACSLGTAPVAWLDFHAVPVWSVPANLVAAPAVVPLLGLALVTPAFGAASPGAGAIAATAAGWMAAYLAACARAFAAIPGAQIRSTRAAEIALACVLLAAAYAWRNAERAEVGLPAHR